MAISTNQKPTIYRNLYENAAPERLLRRENLTSEVWSPRRNNYKLTMAVDP